MIPVEKTGAVAPRHGALQFEERLKKLMTLLLLSACAPQPQTGGYSYNYHPYSGHYADEYTYARAQGTLDSFCELPLVDINRILKSSRERTAKEVICRKDSLNKAVNRVRVEVAKKNNDNAYKAAEAKKKNVSISRSEQNDDIHYYNENSPNTEGGSGVYIDVNHGHAE
jgi:hypothetical protein